MSSEDDYYNERYDYRRSSKKPRRRASSPRRHRRHDSDYFHRKRGRSKAIYNQLASRFAGFIILLVLIVYQVFVFKGAASKNTSSNPSQTSQTRQISTPPHPPTVVDNNPQSHQKPSSPPSPPPPNSSSVNSTAKGSQSSPSSPRNSLPSTAVAAEAASSLSSANAIASKSTVSNPSPSEPKTKSNQLPATAIKMEKKAADEDSDTQTGAASKAASSQTAIDSSGPSSSDQHSISKTAPSGDKGAEPGAGENFWNWFQETKGSDQKGVSKTIPCPEENKRLCQMFYKYIRKYKIRRIFDVSCEKNFEWMGDILKKAGNELWGFKYYCSLWNGQSAGDARKRLQGLPFVVFNEETWWREGFAPDTELLFAWDTLPHLAYGRVWNFFVKARKQDIKYILVDNYPGILNDPSPKHNFLNLRKHPFRFPSAKEVAQNVTEPGETAKRQLLFYETSMLPDNLQ